MTLTVVGTASLFMHIYLYELARQQQESKIVAQKSEIETSRRLAAVGELAGGVAHEINNPLATMQLVTDMLIESPEQWKNEQFMRKHLNMLSNVSERIATTVRSLLHFSRSRSMKICTPYAWMRSWNKRLP